MNDIGAMMEAHFGFTYPLTNTGRRLQNQYWRTHHKSSKITFSIPAARAIL